jgi:G patch domain-containing protein 1
VTRCCHESLSHIDAHGQRGDILGEEQLNSSAKSVFDYMSAKSKERLAQATGAHQTTGVSLTAEEPVEQPDGVLVPPLSPRTASAALKGFIPFADDPAKQERYKSYLTSQTYNTTDPNPKLLPGRPVNEINKELSDFSKSAAMFKPMSFAMANRFTTSSASAQDVAQPKPGLHIPDPDKLDEWTDKSKTQNEVKEVLTPRQEAAKAGMYGAMTRTEENWAPNKLLCKRFGVADPYPDGIPGSTKEETGPTGGTFGTRPLLTAPGQDVAWQNKFINVPVPEGKTAPDPTSGNGPRQPKTLAEVGLADDENQGRDTLTYEKPEIDIFKAIFEDDDDDDDDDDEDQPTGSSRATNVNIYMPPPSKLQQSTLKVAADDAVPAVSAAGSGSEDAASYRPVFARPSAKRDADDMDPDTGANGSKADAKPKRSKKDKKEKKANKILMSFDAGEEEEGDTVRVRKKEKRDRAESRKSRAKASPADALAETEEDMWVEKEVAIPTASTSKRKRAEDFL